jgi:hypothetical protein
VVRDAGCGYAPKEAMFFGIRAVIWCFPKFPPQVEAGSTGRQR